MLPAEAAPAVASQRLRRIINGEPLSIDPHAVFDEAGGALTYDLFEGLISFSADGRTIPGVAESWSVSADGRTCVFTLRAAARWSDGRPLL
ncbi:MAG: peptide ABC transporter substrate-binding protein, partial [Acidobacteria bacterium]|nr:peptide ABC transporter substrate-binding protein [Acidobacteriota bacterium]